MHSTFIRQVLVVASGTAGAQILTMLFSPLITRLYGPEAFGLLGTFQALVLVLIPAAALAYPIAVVLPKSDTEASGLMKLSLFSTLGMSILALLLLLLGGDRLLQALNMQKLGGFIYLVPLAMLFAGGLQIIKQWVIRKQLFGALARTTFTQSLLINSLKTGAGFINPLAAVLVVLATLAHCLHAMVLWFNLKPGQKPGGSHLPLTQLAYHYRDFPFYRAPQQVVNALSQSTPVLFLAAFFGPAAAGFYTLTKTVMALPAALLAKSVGDVFFPRITQAVHNNEPVQKLLTKATLALAALGLVPFAVIAAFGPWLFALVFGEEWHVAGEYARWMSLWLYFAFLNRPAVAAIPALGVQGWFLFYEVSSLLLRIAAIALAYWLYNDDLLAIIAFSVAGMLLNILLITAVWVKAGKGRNIT